MGNSGVKWGEDGESGVKWGEDGEQWSQVRWRWGTVESSEVKVGNSGVKWGEGGEQWSHSVGASVIWVLVCPHIMLDVCGASYFKSWLLGVTYWESTNAV